MELEREVQRLRSNDSPLWFPRVLPNLPELPDSTPEPPNAPPRPIWGGEPAPRAAGPADFAEVIRDYEARSGVR